MAHMNHGRQREGGNSPSKGEPEIQAVHVELTILFS
jgi:hypothetical protein